MDALDRLRDHGLHAEVHRAKGSVLARGALSVALARDDHVRKALLLVRDAVVVELRIARLEDELRVLRDVRAELEPRTRRHDVVRRDLVADLDGAGALEVLGEGLALRNRRDVGSAHDLRALHALPRRRAVEEHRVVYRELLRGGNSGDGVLRRKLHLARERGGRGRLGRDEVDLRGLSSAAPLEVAVVRPERNRARARTHVRADAESARVLEHAASRRVQDRERAVLREHVDDLARAARDTDLYVVRHMPALEVERDCADVAVGRVCARADHDLVDLEALLGLHGHDVARAVRRGHHRLDLREVDGERVVVLRALVRNDLHEVLRAPLRGEELLRHRVGREHARRNAELRAHVRDRRARGDVESRDARSGVLEYPADVALRAVLLEDLEDHVLRGDPLAELPLEDDRAHLGGRDVESAAGHRNGDVYPAGADGDLPDAAARRGVRVAAEKRRAGLAEALEVQLVADAVAALGVDDAVLLRDGLEEVMVVCVLEADLHSVVVDVADGEVRLHARNSHRLELQVRHRAGRVLRECLVDADPELGVLRWIALNEVRGKYLLYDVHLFRFHGAYYTKSSARAAQRGRSVRACRKCGLRRRQALGRCRSGC